MFQLSLSIDVRTGGRPHLVGVMEQSRTAILTRMQGSDCRNNQRPLGDNHLEHNPEEQLVAQVPHQGEEAGSIVLHSSSNVSEFMNDNKEAHVTAFAAGKVSEFMNDNKEAQVTAFAAAKVSDKDAEILRLIKERRSTPKEKKQRIKDLSKRIKHASEKKE